MKTLQKILTVLAVIYMSQNAISQTSNPSDYPKFYTYQDAVNLTKIHNQNEKATSFEESQRLNEQYYGILKKYGIDSTNIKDHPFLDKFPCQVLDSSQFSQKSAHSTDDFFQSTTESGKETSVPESSVSSVSSMNWEAAAINGIATFLAGRFKEEVLHYGINNVFDRILDKDSVLIASLFPKTFSYIEQLQNGGNNSYYSSDLVYLKELVLMDFESMPSNIAANLDELAPKLKNNPELRDGFVLSAGALDYAMKGVPIDKLLTYLSNEDYSSDSSNVYRVVNITDLISHAFRDVEGSGRVWVNPISTLPFGGDDLTLTESGIFYGLLYSQLIEVPQFKTFLESELDGTEQGIKDIAKMLQEIGLVVNKLELIASVLEDRDYEISDINTGVSLIEDLIDVVRSMTQIIGEPLNWNADKIDEVLTLADQSILLTSDIMSKNYQAATAKLVYMIGSLNPNNIELTRILNFVTGLSSINDDDDMEQLLKSYALPIGSAAVKRGSVFNISINGYVGLTGGYETAFASNANVPRWNYGLAAPMGFSMTFFRGSTTLFASIFDLGSIVNQRLKNDTTSYSELRFEQFFTPGASLMYNFKNTPISLSLGASYIPNLRTIKYENEGATFGESGVSVLRVNMALLVDIPFFTVFNKSKRTATSIENDRN